MMFRINNRKFVQYKIGHAISLKVKDHSSIFNSRIAGFQDSLIVFDDFDDGSMRSGLAAPSLEYTGFGTAFVDLDHDGDLDLLIANGRVVPARADPRAAIDPLWNEFAEPNQIFLGDGRGGFVDASVGDSFCRTVEVSLCV